ncbi:MAG: hypothetical protein ABL917_03560 [Parcubacteria group bacterium]
MIDTICLLIPKDEIITLASDSDGKPSWDLHSHTEQYDKFVKNPSKRALERGLYLPRLTGYHRKGFSSDKNVRIEFSIPKLLYLNNLDEVEDKDFAEVIDVLHERLVSMGIVITKAKLENASVSSVHFSKNILVEEGYTVNHIISELNKVNLPKSFDFARTRYINDGQSLYAHTTTHQLVIYDKVADLGKDKKRAIDKDQTSYQKSLFEEIEKKELLEILRFEVRLNRKQKMNSVLEQLGYEKNPTFRSIFRTDISKKVVSGYWNKLIKERSLGLFSISMSIKDVLRTLLVANKGIKPKQAIYYAGLFMVGKDENGLRELRSITSKKSCEKTWYRIVKDMKIASEFITKNRLRDWVIQIDKKLEEYKPYKHKVLSTSDG